jgi:hypothetical protein
MKKHNGSLSVQNERVLELLTIEPLCAPPVVGPTLVRGITHPSWCQSPDSLHMSDEPELTAPALFEALIDQLADVAYLDGGSEAVLWLRSVLPENSNGGSTVSGLELRERGALPASHVVLRDAQGTQLAVVEVNSA